MLLRFPQPLRLRLNCAYISHFLSPAARRLVIEYNVNPAQVKTSGKKNRVLKDDVVRYIKEKNLAMVTGRSIGPWPGQPLSSVSDSTKSPSAQRTSPSVAPTSSATSKQFPKATVPHPYLSAEIQVDELQKFLQFTSNNKIETSREDVFLKSVALALKDVKEFNVLWNDSANEATARLSVDVSLCTSKGQIVEIEGADRKGLHEIFAERNRLLEKPEDMKGSAVCIYDFGTLGVNSVLPIVISPQVGAITIGGKKNIVVMNPEPSTQTTSALSLSFDGRSVNYEVASNFLQKLVFYIENPKQLLIS